MKRRLAIITWQILVFFLSEKVKNFLDDPDAGQELNLGDFTAYHRKLIYEEIHERWAECYSYLNPSSTDIPVFWKYFHLGHIPIGRVFFNSKILGWPKI